MLVGFSLRRPVWPHPLIFRCVVVLAGLVSRLDWPEGPHTSCALRAGGFLGRFPLRGFGFLGCWDDHPFHVVRTKYKVLWCCLFATHYIFCQFVLLGYSCLGSHARVLYGWRGDVILFQTPAQCFELRRSFSLLHCMWQCLQPSRPTVHASSYFISYYILFCMYFFVCMLVGTNVTSGCTDGVDPVDDVSPVTSIEVTPCAT